MDLQSRQLNYGMLNPYETSILTRKPMRQTDVNRLWKSTLARFLIGNGVSCHWKDDKKLLVEKIFELSGEEVANELNLSSSPPLRNPPLVHPPAFVVPMIPPFYAPNNSFSYLTGSPITTNQPAPPLQPPSVCTCHECENCEAPLPADAPPHLMHFPSPQAPQEEAFDEFTFMSPCNALLDLEGLLEDDDFDHSGNFECSCAVPIEGLLQDVTLSADSREIFCSVAESSVPEIVSFLQNFGMEVEGSGCRIHLLLMLRDLLEEQANALSPDAGLVLPVTSRAGGGSPNGTRTPRSTTAAGDSQQRGPTVASIAQQSLEFGRLMIREISPPPCPTETAPKEADETDPTRECCVCLQNPREIAFVPCGHALCCRSCARRLRECPVCRKRVQRRLKLFFS